MRHVRVVRKSKAWTARGGLKERHLTCGAAVTGAAVTGAAVTGAAVTGAAVPAKFALRWHTIPSRPDELATGPAPSLPIAHCAPAGQFPNPVEPVR